MLKTSLSNYQPLRDVSRFLKMLPLNQNWAGQIPHKRKGRLIPYANSNTHWDLIPRWAGVLVFFSNSVSTQTCYTRGHKLCPSHSLTCVQWFFWIWLNILKQETSPKTRESRETWQQEASNLQGLWSVGTPWLLCSVAGQPEAPSATVPATNMHVQHVTPTPAGVLLLRFLQAPAPNKKCKLFVSFIMELFIAIGKRGCTHIWNVNWELLIQEKRSIYEKNQDSVFRWTVSQLSFHEALTRQCHHVEQY